MNKNHAEKISIDSWKRHRKAVEYFERQGKLFCEKFGVTRDELHSKKKPH
ncbi:hypothetical protein SJZ84_01435 [Hafnia paralvei]|nr:hypothetical protein [Hafnia paralvei]MDX6909493.1 hypothetical protein [Hafnia paralvei]